MVPAWFLARGTGCWGRAARQTGEDACERSADEGPVPVTQAERLARTARADALCAAALEKALDGADATGLALVAVGGYGRAELAPHSDLDVVLVHDDGAGETMVRTVAEDIWYPLWDAGTDLDHSVRALSEVIGAAGADPRVAL